MDDDLVAIIEKAKQTREELDALLKLIEQFAKKVNKPPPK